MTDRTELRREQVDRETAHLRFKELQAEGGKVAPAELDEIWAALETVRPEEILGRWKGSEFDNGHPLCGMLASMGWYGKTFNSALDAKPLIMRGTDGQLFSDVETGKGEASLWMIEFRGECTATMVYDGQPIFDHFKRVDQDTLMGIMNGKTLPDAIASFPEGEPLFTFVLERDV
jgi:hypothetical protein